MKRDTINYVTVGGFVLLMLVALLYGLYRVTGHQRQQDTYYTRLANVTGIAEGSTVTFEGYPVGNVTAIEPVAVNGRTRYRLALNLKSGWRVPEDSSATITAPGLLAAPVIEIRQGASPTLIAPGGEIPGADAAGLFQAMTGLMTEISALTESGIKPLVAQLNARVDRLGDTLAKSLPETLEEAKGALVRLNRAAGALESLASGENREHLASMLRNSDQTAANLARLSADLERTRGALDALLAESHGAVAGGRQDVRASLAELRQSVDRVNGMLHQLESASRHMNEFSRNLRANPGALIQGRPPVDPVEAKP